VATPSGAGKNDMVGTVLSGSRQKSVLLGLLSAFLLQRKGRVSPKSDNSTLGLQRGNKNMALLISFLTTYNQQGGSNNKRGRRRE